MNDSYKIISDYKRAIEEREVKINSLKGNKFSLVYKKDIDEIENDFYEDTRVKEYHKLRRTAKEDSNLQRDFMDIQSNVFNC